MNRKGFTLIELLGCLALLGVILCIGLYTARGTLATALSTLTDASVSQIYNATNNYILENKITWINKGEEYVCVEIESLVDSGYFSEKDVVNYKNEFVRVVRDSKTKTITEMSLMGDCK